MGTHGNSITSTKLLHHLAPMSSVVGPGPFNASKSQVAANTEIFRLLSNTGSS